MKESQALEELRLRLRRAEENLEIVTENLEAGLFIASVDGTMRHWNRAALAMHDFQPGENTKDSLPDFIATFELLTLDGTPVPLEDWPMPRVFRGEKLRNVPMRLRRRDGSWERIYSYTTELVSGADGTLGVVQIADVTEQRRARQRLETQSAVSRVLAEGLGLDETIPRLLTAIAESEGALCTRLYRVEGDMLSPRGHHCRKPIDADPPSAPVARGEGVVGAAWASGAPQSARDAVAFPVVVHDEVDSVVQVYGAISADLETLAAIGRQIGMFIGRKREEAERRRLEHTLLQAQKLEALGQLSGGIAHDFNNLLTAIRGNLELAVATVGPDAPVQPMLADIGAAAERATNLVRQILTFARHEPHARKRAPLKPIFTESVQLLRATLPKDIELVATMDAPEAHALIDPTQVEQVIVNLGTNAWHAVAQQGGRIALRLDEVRLDGDETRELGDVRPGAFVRITVEDNGEGMTAATRERMFEPFFTTKPLGKGTGLGLSVVHGIIRGHGGAIRVDSEPGRGTRVEVLFPVDA